MADYEHALTLNPEYPEALNRLGVVLTGTGQLNDAIAHFKKALTLRPGNASIHRNFGWALQKAGRTDEAQCEFAEAERLDHP